MWAYPVWFLLISLCPPDGGECSRAVVQGFVNRDLCEAASKPLSGLLEQVLPPGDWKLEVGCVPVPMREA